jgi:hypothetical protein
MYVAVLRTHKQAAAALPGEDYAKSEILGTRLRDATENSVIPAGSCKKGDFN